jgi:hypothetical protein
MTAVTFKMAMVFIITICLIVSGFSVYLMFFAQENVIKEEPVKEIDDRISPLTQQGVFLEIHRIRVNGIIDQIMNDCFGTRLIDNLPIDDRIKKMLDSLVLGVGWDKKPIFTFNISLDGYKFDEPIDYKAWDTGYINYNLYRLIEKWLPDGSGYTEDNETTEVKVNFIMKEKKLGRLIDKETEGFKVTYDFRTGRWTGDDSFNDSDGYGHYLGKRFEVWFSIYQTDFDDDGIPYWTEVNVLNTSPRMDDRKLDPDNDGIPTAWEWEWGYNHTKWDNHSYLDPDGDGLQNVEEYFMEKWLANPYCPEIYVEVDYMEKAPFRLFDKRLDGWDHFFYEESQQMIMERYSEHGITFHVDDGRMGGGGDILPFMKSNYETDGNIYHKGASEMVTGIIAGYYNNNFADERKGIFRYLLILHGGGEAYAMDYGGCYDTMTVPMNRLSYKDNHAILVGTQRMRRIGNAVGVLHELGHTCGFGLLNTCGGCDNLSEGSREEWNDYMSVMNYHKYFVRLFDYSDGTHGINDFDDWGNIDVGFFQRTSDELEGIGFTKAVPPYNRPQ